MISPATLHRWAFAGLFVILGAMVVFMRMLPLDDSTSGWPPPDVIVLTGFAWVVRRPDFVPVLLFAALLLVTDLLFLRPPGVASALGVIGLEVMRNRAGLLAERGFFAEWMTAGIVLTLMLLAERVLLALFFVAQPGFGLTVIGLIINIVAYPAVVAVSVLGFRVRRLAPGEHASEARLV